MFYLSFLTLFCVSIISARPAPRIIYSAVIYNAQNSPITCSVVWSEPNDRTLESAPFTLGVNKYHLVEQKIIDMGGWEGSAIIRRINCGDLSLSAPFDKVNSPAKYWQFHVEENRIVSDGRSAYGY